MLTVTFQTVSYNYMLISLSSLKAETVSLDSVSLTNSTVWGIIWAQRLFVKNCTLSCTLQMS